MKLFVLAMFALLLTSCAVVVESPTPNVVKDGLVTGWIYPAYNESNGELLGWYFLFNDDSKKFYFYDKSPLGIVSHGLRCSYQILVTYRMKENTDKMSFFNMEFLRLLSAKHTGTGKNCPK